MKVDLQRVYIFQEGRIQKGPIVYWMSRDQRVSDNWALLYAQELAIARKEPLYVVFCLVDSFLGAPLRPYEFMLRGLSEVERELKKKNIPFFLIQGEPSQVLPPFLCEKKASSLVCDFSPLRLCRKWKKEVAKQIRIPISEVDARDFPQGKP
ncbi:MAG: deoxyribodipyrimidine photo-lyase [Chlamydiota bacterium]